MNNMILHMLYHILRDACILEVLIVIAILLWLFNWLSVYSTWMYYSSLRFLHFAPSAEAVCTVAISTDPFTLKAKIFCFLLILASEWIFTKHEYLLPMNPKNHYQYMVHAIWLMFLLNFISSTVLILYACKRKFSSQINHPDLKVLLFEFTDIFVEVETYKNFQLFYFFTLTKTCSYNNIIKYLESRKFYWS